MFKDKDKDEDPIVDLGTMGSRSQKGCETVAGIQIWRLVADRIED